MNKNIFLPTFVDYYSSLLRATACPVLLKCINTCYPDKGTFNEGTFLCLLSYEESSSTFTFLKNKEIVKVQFLKNSIVNIHHKYFFEEVTV